MQPSPNARPNRVDIGLIVDLNFAQQLTPSSIGNRRSRAEDDLDWSPIPRLPTGAT